jgi:hypothetical protein
MLNTSSRFSQFIVFVILFLAGAPPAFAQNSGSNGDDFSLFVGHMLPHQINGVDEILPVFGGRYAFGTSFGAIELGGQNTHAAGLDFSTLTLDLRGEIPLAQGVSGLLYLGPVLNYYTEKDASERKLEYGIEAGAGAMMLISDTLWLRGDMKFMGGPGTSLYILFGFVFRTSGTGQ